MLFIPDIPTMLADGLRLGIVWFYPLGGRPPDRRATVWAWERPHRVTPGERVGFTRPYPRVSHSMSDRARSRFAGRSTDRYLGYAAAVLAYVVAALHLSHPSLGFGRLALLVSVNPELLLADPRAVAFVLSGIALLAGVPLASVGRRRRVVYALGIALVAVYVLGYFAWHLSGHGGFLPGREPLHHGLQPHEAVVNHLSGSVWAAAALVAEVLLGGVLIVLYRRES
jgi:hypothetical protein